MYDRIYLINRIGSNGKIKRRDVSFLDNSLKTCLWGILIISIIIYLIFFLFQTEFIFTIDLFFEMLLQYKFLQFLLCFIFIVGLLIYFCFRKKRHSVAFQVDLENDSLIIVFNEGKHIGMEYKLSLHNISNICMYKNGCFSFYSNYIEVDKDSKLNEMKATIKFIGGDSGVFISDLQDYLGRNIKFINKKC